MPVKHMLDTYPRTFNVDADLIAQTIEALIDCANTCSHCADACLSENDVARAGLPPAPRRHLLTGWLPRVWVAPGRP